MRRAELPNLCLDDLDLRPCLATVTGKGEKTRTVVFDALCLADLERWLEGRAQCRVSSEVKNVFISADGRPLHLNTISMLVRSIAKAAGLRKAVWTHLFRHTSVTRLLEQGMQLQDVAALHGHASFNTTAGYVHPDPARLKKEYDRVTRGRGKEK
jgi:integrase/recombinase XerC